jgi:hypothetical protein
MAAAQPVIAIAALEPVVPPAADQLVGAVMAFQPVVTGAAVQAIATVLPDQPIVAAVADLPGGAMSEPSTVLAHRSSPKESDKTDAQDGRSRRRSSQKPSKDKNVKSMSPTI